MDVEYLFMEILAWNVALDKADCYSASESLAGHIKNAFLGVTEVKECCSF